MPAAGAMLAALRMLVTVLDPQTGLALAGLGADDFVTPSQVEAVAVADAPLAVLLVVDGSAAGDGVRAVAADLIGQLRGRDRAALLAFRGEVQLLRGFTEDREALRQAVAAMTFQGDPRMLDGLAAAVDVPFPEKGFRKVIVLVTAGIEGPNRTTESAVAQAAREKGIAVYPVYLHGSGRWSFPGLARQTGGAPFWLREVRGAEGIMGTIRSPYLVTLRGGSTPKLKGREKTFVSSLPYSIE